MSTDRPPRHAAPRSPYWRKTLRLTLGLLALWFVTTLVVGLFGRSLNFQLFGWPVGFWAASQGALLVFCAIVWLYAFAMDGLDREHGDNVGD